MLGTMSRTSRGFQLVEFLDRYEQPCELQQSSLADYVDPEVSAVWLGLAGQDQMHLDLEQVKGLITLLSTWVSAGSFQ